MRRTALMLAAIALFAATAAAAERVVLDNGLTVILAPRPSGEAVAARAFVHGGRAAEPPDLAGISHLVEHLLYRSTKRRAAGAAEQEIWACGGRSSAFTTENFTEYGALVPAARLDLALDVLAGAIAEPLFLPEEVEAERRVVLDEISRGEAEASSVAFLELRRLAFAPHPYGERTYGTVATVRRIGAADLSRYWTALARPERTVLVLAGAFERDAALAAVRRSFGSFAAAPGAPPEAPAAPDNFGRYSESALFRPGAAPALYLSAALPGYLHPDYLPTRFLKEILAGWLTQRLVIERKVALSAEAWFSPLGDRNLLSVRVNLKDASAAGPARYDLLGLLAELRRPDFAPTGIPEIARFFSARELLMQEDPEELARAVGRAAMYGYYAHDGVPALLAAPDRYDRVTGDDVRRVAARWLAPANLRVLWLLPPGAAVPPPVTFSEPAAGGAFGGEPRSARLPGPEPDPYDGKPARLPADGDAATVEIAPGLTLHHLERPGLPLVSAAISYAAGSRYQSPYGPHGVAALTLRAMAASSAAEGADLRWRMYALGNSWSLTTDRDLAVISLTVPAEGIEEALRTVSAILKDATLPDTAIEEARGALLASERAAAERISTFAGAAFRVKLFGGSPYRFEPGGSAEGLKGSHRSDVADFRRNRFVFGRAFLALVGDVPPRRARELASLLTPPVDVAESPPALDFRRDGRPGGQATAVPHPSGRAYLITGAHAPRAGDPLEAEAGVLQLALGWQVFRHFTKDDSSAYEAGAFYEALAEDGDFGLYAGVAPDRAEEAAAAIDSILSAARERPLPPDLVAAAREAYLGGTALASAKSVNVAVRLARRAAYGAPFDDLRRRVAALTAEDLRAAAAAILAEEELLRLRVGP